MFVERLWQSIKYEQVYLQAYEAVSAVKTRIGKCKHPEFYNVRRPHSALDVMTWDEFYYQHLPALEQAA